LVGATGAAVAIERLVFGSVLTLPVLPSASIRSVGHADTRLVCAVQKFKLTDFIVEQPLEVREFRGAYVYLLEARRAGSAGRSRMFRHILHWRIKEEETNVVSTFHNEDLDMDNKHPKSEMPALKEAAAAAKDKQGLQKSIENEHQHQHDAPLVDKGPISRSK
jgi:hypothetical protein